jgi:hypothetical protein
MLAAPAGSLNGVEGEKFLMVPFLDFVTFMLQAANRAAVHIPTVGRHARACVG